MAREGVVSRGTASRYIEAAISLGFGPSDELTDERVRGVAQCVQARTTAGRVRSAPVARDAVHPNREVAQAGRADEPLTLVRIHELLARDGSDVSHATLRRWAQTTLGIGNRSPTVRWMTRLLAVATSGMRGFSRCRLRSRSVHALLMTLESGHASGVQLASASAVRPDDAGWHTRQRGDDGVQSRTITVVPRSFY